MMNQTTTAINSLPNESIIRPVSPWIWPGILCFGPAFVVVASFITLFFILQHPDGMVASDSYKQGKAINANLSQLKEAARMGVDRPTVSMDGNTFRIHFTPVTGVKMDERVEITLAHPVDLDKDIRQMATLEGEGSYLMVIPPEKSVHERRRVIVTNAPLKTWRVEALYVPPKK